MNKATLLSYFCSKDPDKLTQFIWQLPYKIEIKSIQYANKKWWCWFNHADEKDIRKVNFKNLDLDSL